MLFEIRRGQKISKGDFKQDLRFVNFHKTNSVRFFAILEDAGYINVRGKVIVVRKNLKLR